MEAKKTSIYINPTIRVKQQKQKLPKIKKQSPQAKGAKIAVQDSNRQEKEETVIDLTGDDTPELNVFQIEDEEQHSDSPLLERKTIGAEPSQQIFMQPDVANSSSLDPSNFLSLMGRFENSPLRRHVTTNATMNSPSQVMVPEQKSPLPLNPDVQQQQQKSIESLFNDLFCYPPKKRYANPILLGSSQIIADSQSSPGKFSARGLEHKKRKSPEHNMKEKKRRLTNDCAVTIVEKLASPLLNDQEDADTQALLAVPLSLYHPIATSPIVSTTGAATLGILKQLDSIPEQSCSSANHYQQNNTQALLCLAFNPQNKEETISDINLEREVDEDDHLFPSQTSETTRLPFKISSSSKLSTYELLRKVNGLTCCFSMFSYHSVNFHIHLEEHLPPDGVQKLLRTQHTALEFEDDDVELNGNVFADNEQPEDQNLLEYFNSQEQKSPITTLTPKKQPKPEEQISTVTPLLSKHLRLNT